MHQNTPLLRWKNTTTSNIKQIFPEYSSMHTSTTTTFLAITLCWMFSSGDTQGNAIGPELNKGHASIVARGDVGWIGPGQSFNIIIAVTPDPDWHVYWKNPGRPLRSRSTLLRVTKSANRFTPDHRLFKRGMDQHMGTRSWLRYLFP